MKQLRAFDRRVLGTWLPLAFVITLLFVAIYGTAQHILRQAANDPQIQIAEDSANSLANGASPESLTASAQSDIASSLAVFATVYNAQGKSIASTGKLNGLDPHLPAGVLNYTKIHSEDRFTWQPQDTVRIAAVTRAYKTTTGTTGFILVGRNLREIEKRENQLLILLAVGWAITMAGSLGLKLALMPKR